MSIIRFIVLLLLGGLLACQKPTDALQPTNPTTPDDTLQPPSTGGVVYPKGTPIGQAIQKTIGPEGGTLSSVDGTLTLQIPAGAVAKATLFAVQPVTPTLPNLIGQHAYRLLPEGQTFAKPITLRYQYNADSLDATSAQLLFMAYQNSDGLWKALPDTELDETTHTLTVSTQHFSDWGAFAEFVFKTDRDMVAPGESATLRLEGFSTIALGSSGEAVEIPLARVAVLADANNIKNWRLQGKGSLQVEPSQTQATFTAPQGGAGSLAVVSVDIYNFIPPSQRPRPRASGKAVMLKTIYISGNSFEVHIDGQVYPLSSVFGVVDERGITLGGTLIGTHHLIARIRSRTATPGTLVAYKAESGQLDNNAEINLSLDQKLWKTWYQPCFGDDLMPSPGGIRIEGIDRVGDKRYLRGSLTAQIYNEPESCEVYSKLMTAKFKILLVDD